MNEDGLILLELLCLYHNNMLQHKDIPTTSLYLNNLNYKETKEFLSATPIPETLKPKIIYKVSSL